MRLGRALVSSVALGIVLAFTAPAEAKIAPLRFPKQYQPFDPHALNETFTLGFHGNIYEGLTRRTPDLEIEPALAVSWEMVEPTRWRVKLREGVTFHSGHPFTADDVIFSFERASSDAST